MREDFSSFFFFKDWKLEENSCLAFKAKGGQEHIRGKLRFSVLFNYKYKVAFGRRDSTLEGAKSLPMEKITKSQLMIRALKLHSASKHSSSKTDTFREGNA